LKYAALSIMTGAAAGRQYYNYAMASEEVASLGVAFFLLAYISIANGVVAILFKMQTGMTIIGKDPKTGKLPLWSYIVWGGFHLPTFLYTYIHTELGTYGHRGP